MQSIAIVGMSCRLPGAPNPKALWELVCNGNDAIGPVPPTRWNVEEYFDKDPKRIGKMYTIRGGFLDQIDGFDANCFGISPREAIHMDPQQRLMLELAWEVFEDAGIPHRTLAGSSTGVFLGFGAMEYALTQLRNPELIDGYTNTGYFPCIISNRISYHFDLRGPSLSLDTACSSSLVAVHLACESLRKGESNLALAGGISLMIDPVTTIAFCKLSALSPNGRCNTFDAKADGYVRGEGAGIVLLKRLEEAQHDGDHIYAVILGEAVNQDGKSNGLTAPNRLAQENVLRQAYSSASRSPQEVHYVEAHGTGTFLGDPIEIHALGNVLGAGRPADHPLLVGSLKTNIGHLESAAGVAGLIKLAMSIEKGLIPPHLHFEQPNPHIPFDQLRTKVVTTIEEWPNHSGERLAGLSSFGFGGTNAHLVLGQSKCTPSIKIDQTETRASLLTLSSRSPESLRELANQYVSFLNEGVDIPSFNTVCNAAAQRRTHLEYRTTVVAHDKKSAASKLTNWLDEKKLANKSKNNIRIAFLFSGQGSQYLGMGRELYQTEPLFREVLSRCDELLIPYLGCSLCELLFEGSRGDKRLDQTSITQPAIFALQWGLVTLWRSWGITPDIVLGHSIGEIAAACSVGMIHWEEGLHLSAQRGALMQSLPDNGGMLVVLASRDWTARLLDSHQLDLAIAASNGPLNTVVSGRLQEIDRAKTLCNSDRVATHRLLVSHPFHSIEMDPILDSLQDAANRCKWRPSNAPFVANLTGEIVESGSTLTGEYFRAHARSEVRFQSAIESLASWRPDLCIEIGADSTLSEMARKCAPNSGITWQPSMRRNQDALSCIFSAMGAAYELGATFDWRSIYKGSRPYVSLPHYPFHRTKYWESRPISITRHDAPNTIQAEESQPSLLGEELDTHSPIFQSAWNGQRFPWFQDHRISGQVIAPATAYIEMAFQFLASQRLNPNETALRELNFEHPLLLGSTLETTVQLHKEGAHHFCIAAKVAESVRSSSPNRTSNPNTNLETGPKRPWTRICSGTFGTLETPMHELSISEKSIGEKICRPESMRASSLYQQLLEVGLDYGPAFRLVDRIWIDETEAWGEIVLHRSLIRNMFHFDPMVLDACFHVVAGFILAHESTGPNRVMIPAGIRSIAITSHSSDRVLCRVHRSDEMPASNQVAVDLDLFTPEGECIGAIKQLRLAPAFLGTAKPSPFRGTGVSPTIIRGTGVSPVKGDSWAGRPSHDNTRVGRPIHLAGSELDATGSERLRSVVSLEFHWVELEQEPPIASGMIEREYLWDGDHLEGELLGEEIALRGGSWTALKSPNIDLTKPFQDRLANKKRTLVLSIDLDGVPIPKQDIWSQVGASCRASLLRFQQVASWESVDEFVLFTRGTASLHVEGAQEPATPASVRDMLGQVLAAWFRSLRLENARWQFRHIDLDANVPLEDQWSIVANELIKSGGASEIAIRNSRVYRKYLVQKGVEQSGSGERSELFENRELSFSVKGSLNNLEQRRSKRRLPMPNEVELQVRSTGLNFRDVLNVLGMYPGDAGPLGGECAGIVTAVGDSVCDFRVGDCVTGFAAGSFSNYVTTHSALLATIPAHMDFAEASAFPIATVTASLGLHHFGKIAKGDRVLIHAATGGVGLAAVRLALRAGATVFATAGTKAKRSYLHQLGVQHVADSRSIDFDGEITEQVQGEKMDIVLNSLSGEFIPRSLALLKPGGRFIEIGKIGIWSATEVARKYPGLLYHCFDLAELAKSNPDFIGDVLRRELAKNGSDDPPSRVEIFSMEHARDAFRRMSQAKHLGKIAIVQSTNPPFSSKLFDAEHLYLVTGGLGGIGKKLIPWMALHGAKKLALLQRRPPSEQEMKLVAQWHEQGLEVSLHVTDATDSKVLNETITELESHRGPVRGVFHLAGLLRDGIAQNMKWEPYREVLQAKGAIAWNLHQRLKSNHLHHFVLFSSIASILGSPGQSSYAAANGFLEGLARLRRNAGLAAQSIHWGPWAGEGMAKVYSEERSHSGIHKLEAGQGLEVLENLIRSGAEHATVVAVEPMQFTKAMQSMIALENHYSIPSAAMNQHDANEMRRHDFLQQLSSAKPEDRLRCIMAFLQAMALGVLGLPEKTSLDLRQPLAELGLDSLMAVEMRNLLSEVTELTLDTTILFDHPTIESLAKFLDEKMRAKEVEQRESLDIGVPSSVESLSIEQLAHELARELDSLRRQDD